MKIAFKRCLRTTDYIKGITPRRLAAARRALKREQNKLPLFAELIAEIQPTPEQRITNTDLDLIRSGQMGRDRRARQWREIRVDLRSLFHEDREGILGYWNTSHLPKDPSYLAGLISRWTLEGWRPAFYGEEDQRRWAEGRIKVDQLLARWRAEGRLNSPAMVG